MSGIDIANLSYKELQALALRYRVPGNIKKQLLIEVLRAAKCGNEQEVDKLLADLRQTRKKRIRKGKPTKLTMSLASTPIHSPNYDMADDYYGAQHRLPYQWVGAEEEIPNRQDEANRVPQYEEFRQFLLRRIQRDYQTYNADLHSERVDPGGIMDLRNDQGEFVRFETDAPVGVLRSTNIVPMNSAETAQPYSAQVQGQNAAFDYQIFEDPNGNGSASFLLRRMLQAPVGANLGEIASPELQGPSCRVWNAEYQSQNNLLDNSDTLSANSDVNGNDDNDWPIGNEYYRLVNNVRDQLILQQNTGVVGSLQSDREFHEQTPATGQLCGVLTDENPAQYQILYSDQINDVPEQYQGHQQWEPAPGVFENDNVLNYQKLKNHGPKIFGVPDAPFYDAAIAATDYATPRGPETDPLQLQPYPNGDGLAEVGYLANQNGFEGNNSSASATSKSEMKFYQNLNNEADRANLDVCSAPIRQDHETNYSFPRAPMHPTIYYADSESQQQTQGLMPEMRHLSFFPHNQHLQAPPPAHNGGYAESLVPASTGRSSQIEELCNRPSILGQYHNAITDKVNPLIVESEQLYQPDAIRRMEAESEPEARNKTVLGSTSTVQSDSTTSLEAFWPQRSGMGQKYAKDKCLENVLNLSTYGYVDYSKIDQTSCIYCYSAPIVTQRLFSASSMSTCSQKKRFIAEIRRHTFSPYWLLYSDTATGMRMSRDVGEIQGSVVVRQKAETIIPSSFDNDAKEENARNNDDDINNNVPPSETNDSDFRLEELKSNPRGQEVSLLEANVQLHIQSDGSNEDGNDLDEMESSLNLNMENTSEEHEIEDENPPSNA